MKEQIDSLSSSGSYEYFLSDSNEAQRLIEQGVITQKEYNDFLKIKNEENTVNLGYAFVTFSHTEETKLAIVLTAEMMLPEGPLETFLKGKLDHGDLDPQWYFNKLKNDAKLVDEMEALREAKKELRDFEKNIDKDLVSCLCD